MHNDESSIASTPPYALALVARHTHRPPCACPHCTESFWDTPLGRSGEAISYAILQRLGVRPLVCRPALRPFLPAAQAAVALQCVVHEEQARALFTVPRTLTGIARILGRSASAVTKAAAPHPDDGLTWADLSDEDAARLRRGVEEALGFTTDEDDA